MKTGTKIALIIGGIVIVGVSAYFIIKSVNKKRDEKKAEEKAKAIKDASKLDPNRSGKYRYTTDKDALDKLGVYKMSEADKLRARRRFDSGNPFPDLVVLKKFQDWVINTKNDKDILGKNGADGNWSVNSAAAFNKYRGEWFALEN
jgi:hypothetical protein